VGSDAVDAGHIGRAREAIGHVVKHTPVVSSGTLSGRTGGEIVLKAENLQRTGAFKIRGAMNKLTSLGDAAVRGVTCGSAGNHAQALAFAAQHHGVECEIFVPSGAPISKIEACQGYGAKVTEVGSSLDEAVSASLERAESSGLVFCHPFDDPVVVAGQGTLGLELLDDIADLATVIVPLGGGGLACGTAIAVKSALPHVRVIGVQAEACAPYAGRIVANGAVVTLADGIAVKSPGEITRPLVERWLDEVVTVDEDSIADAMVLLMERSKLYVEGAGAVGVSALTSGVVAADRRGVTCVVVSGGNVDLGVVPGLIRRHENQAGRRLDVFARIDDRPGGLAKLLAVFADGGANLIEVEHVREGIDLHVRETGVHATFEVRGRDHARRLVDAATAEGYELRTEATGPAAYPSASIHPNG
jgi:threonine dehydratase